MVDERFKKRFSFAPPAPLVALAAVFLLSTASTALSRSGVLAPSAIDVSDFSSMVPAGKLPAHWKIQTFPSIDLHTEYTLVEDPIYGPVIRAEAAASAAGLVRRLSVDPQEYPILSWSWKISKTLEGSSLTARGGDDFPARLLVSFAGDLFGGSLQRTLCYVWATTEVVETTARSPYHKDVVTIVASSGNSRAGSWQDVRRNIVEDYLRVYHEMPGPLRAISLLSDADDTGGSAVAWYGHISLNR